MTNTDSNYVTNIRGLMIGRNSSLSMIAEAAEKYVDAIPGLTEEIAKYTPKSSGQVNMGFAYSIRKANNLLDGLQATWLKNEGEQLLRVIEGVHFNLDMCKRLVSPFIANLLSLSISIQTAKHSSLSAVSKNENAGMLLDIVKYLSAVKNMIDNKQFKQASQILEDITALDGDEIAQRLIMALHKEDSGGNLIDELIEKVEARAEQLMTDNTDVKHCIMLVDDRPEILETVGGYLKDLYKVLPLTRGTLALKAMEKQKIDLFVLDIDMPDMDGITLTAKIRALPEYKKTPLIILTANARREYVLAAMKAGVNDFLIKPPKRDEIVVKIAGFLKNAETSA